MPSSKFSLALLPDLTGKVVLLTGGTSGLGEISARNMALKGAVVFFTARSAAKAQQSIDKAQQHRLQYGKRRGEDAAAVTLRTEARMEDHLIPLICDLGDLASIKAAVHTFLSHPRALSTSATAAAGEEAEARLDILMNNAGVCAVEYSLTKDGLEMQNGTNLVAHYFLTLLLLPTLVRTSRRAEYASSAASTSTEQAKAQTVRIVFLSSLGHKLTPASRGKPPSPSSSTTEKVDGHGTTVPIPPAPPSTLANTDGESKRGAGGQQPIGYRTLEEMNDSFGDVKFSAFRRYAVSKLGTILLTRHLAQRLRSPLPTTASSSPDPTSASTSAPAIAVVCADPGQSKTNLVSGPIASYGLAFKLYNWLSTPTYLSPEQAVETQLYAACSPLVDTRGLSGHYLSGAGKLVLADGQSSASVPKELLGGLGTGGQMSASATDRLPGLGEGALARQIVSFCDEFFRDKLGVDARALWNDAGLAYEGPLQAQ